MTSRLSEAIKHDAKSVEGFLGERLPEEDICGKSYGILIEAMRYSAVECGGKRIRPFLTFEFCRMLNGKTNTACLCYGGAVEAIHNYSLIHDDLPCMDNDFLRRGKPTCHARYGEANALLAGDALLTAAFEWVIDDGSSPSQNIEAVKLLSEFAGRNGMAGGQVLDIMGESKALSPDVFFEMNRMKTGALIRLSCLLGCVAAGYGKGTREYEAADRYGSAVGLAFQIEDDLLDEGTEDGKQTFLSFMSREQAVEKINDLTDEAVAVIGQFEGSEILADFARYLAGRDK